jgi:hypothetical protein
MPREDHIVDWYRVDNGPRMRRVLIAGPSLLSLGGVIMGVSFLTREPYAVRACAAIFGIAVVAMGGALTMGGMYRILRDDTYLAIRTDGVLLRTAATGDSAEVLVPWDGLTRARWDRDRAVLVLERKEGEALEVATRFAGMAGQPLADRIEQARRRVSLGIFPG